MFNIEYTMYRQHLRVLRIYAYSMEEMVEKGGEKYIRWNFWLLYAYMYACTENYMKTRVV